jgi:hypothetical protein
MGFNKKYLPPVEEMKKTRDSYGSDFEYLQDSIGKYDCLIGSKESLDYLNELEEREKCQKSQNY